MPTAAAERAGVLRVDKPEGPTSHDIVSAARRALRMRRIGHTGTLDPFASGLLLLCLGRATRIAEYLTPLPKRYRARIRCGTATDTDDLTGRVTGHSEAWRALTTDAIRDALDSFTGVIEQVPPAYSARKVGGVAMHRLARAGRAPALAPSRVTVHAIRVLTIEPPDLDIEVDCSAGTYIRALARDLGAALGTLAHLAALRRTRIGRHDVADAIDPVALEQPDAVERAWLTPLQALDHLPRVTLAPDQLAAVRNGRSLPAPAGPPADGLVALTHAEQLVAVAVAGSGWLRPRKVLLADA